MSKEEHYKELRDKVLAEAEKGNVVIMSEGFLAVANLDNLISQPADGILYDLNRLESVALSFIDDPKWVNDFAVAKVIKALKDRIEYLEQVIVKK